MKKFMKPAALLVCALMLVACGKISGEQAKESSFEKKNDPSESASESSSAEQVLASVKAVNSRGDDITSPVPDADKLYSYVRGILDPEMSIDGFDDPQTLTVAFIIGNERFLLSSCGEDVFSWRHEGGTAYYMVEHDSAEQLRSRMAAYAALGEIVNGGYDIDTATIETSLLKALAEETKYEAFEQRGYYVNEMTNDCYIVSVSNDGVYYCKDGFGDGFYEFFCRDLNGYCRYSDEDIFYETNVFEGEMDIETLPASIDRGYSYSGSFTVTADKAYTVERYNDALSSAYLLFDDSGSLCAAWSLDNGSMSLIREYSIVPKSIDFDGLFAHAAEHTADKQSGQEDDLPKTDADWLKYDTERLGLFDLSGEIVEGAELQSSNVVQSWRDYIADGNPFTMEYHFVGAGRDQYEIHTSDGTRYYTRHDMDTHDGDRNVGGEEIFVDDGMLYQTSYYLDEYDTREFRAYPLSMYEEGVRCSIDLLFNSEYEAEMTRAYEVTIDGEQYICEEWALYLNRLYKVYIKDGQIIGYLGDFYEKPVVYTFRRLEMTADASLIKKPDNALAYQSND